MASSNPQNVCYMVVTPDPRVSLGASQLGNVCTDFPPGPDERIRDLSRQVWGRARGKSLPAMQPGPRVSLTKSASMPVPLTQTRYVENTRAPSKVLDVVTFDTTTQARQPGKWLEWIHIKITGGVEVCECALEGRVALAQHKLIR